MTYVKKMEIEIEELEIITRSSRSLRIPNKSSIERRDSDINDNLHYISLKDIMCNTSTRCLLYEGNVFDSDIAIKNGLVKRAASVYLQSTRRY